MVSEEHLDEIHREEHFEEDHEEGDEDGVALGEKLV